MTVTYNDPNTTWDAVSVTYDGVGGVVAAVPGQGVSVHDLLTPQQLIFPGEQWSREEAERWMGRLRPQRQEYEDMVRAEDEIVRSLIIALEMEHET